MAAATTPDTPCAPRPLMPAGTRWGVGAGSVYPYLTEAWSARPNNPVFTPEHVAAIVWPAAPAPARQDPLHA